MNDMPWIKSYPAGVRWNIDIVPGPVQKILEDTVAKYPDRPAIDFMGKRLTYRELNDQVNHAARGLQKLGVKPGVHVGLFLPNTPHYLIAFFGVLKAGFARFIVIEPSPHEWQQLMGGGCRNDAATDGIKQHCAKLIFKVFDAFADSRLCDVQFLGST